MRFARNTRKLITNSKPVISHRFGTSCKVFRALGQLAACAKVLTRRLLRTIQAELCPTWNPESAIRAHMFRFQLVRFGYVATFYFTFVALRKARRYQLPGCRFGNRRPNFLSDILRNRSHELAPRVRRLAQTDCQG
jgi:hypothetical protein